MIFLRNLNILIAFFYCFSLNAQSKNVLVFHKTEGFWHQSIPTGYQAIEDLGEENGFKVKETNNAKIFEGPELGNFDLIIFLNTTGDVLDEIQQKNFEGYIKEGGSFFGIHAAADTEYEWNWYGRLIGAYFVDHPEVQSADIKVLKPKHPTVAHLPGTWTRTDEWYNYRIINDEIKVLLNLDENTYSGGKMGEEHPIAWFQDLQGGGRSVYTGGGHTIASYVEPLFVEHLLQCILFAMEKTARKK